MSNQNHSLLFNEDGTPDLMNAAWGQICDMDKICLFLDESHKTVANIRARKAFTVALADVAHLAEADYVGIASGNKTPDKAARAGLASRKSEFVDAPVFDAFPLVMECELAEVVESLGAFVGRILNTAAEERVLAENGKVDPAKLGAFAFDQFQNGYYALGAKVGQAFHDGKKFFK